MESEDMPAAYMSKGKGWREAGEDNQEGERARERLIIRGQK